MVLPPVSGSVTGLKVAIIAPVTVSVVLFIILGCRFLIRKARRKFYGQHYENAANDITNVECSQFKFRAIEIATNHFAHDNKLGEGGFGKVYKRTSEQDLWTLMTGKTSAVVGSIIKQSEFSEFWRILHLIWTPNVDGRTHSTECPFTRAQCMLLLGQQTQGTLQQEQERMQKEQERLRAEISKELEKKMSSVIVTPRTLAQ
ncbi:Cysteine-rich receptor-like protein kinase 25 [Morella rubra]|uniref:Cysteine-rich receptor-like protein kinase 25 n=1 Tax=Morella rubra TaxID=262757 RepID=A0A6A1V2B7_9ROSI|nr:Cysteine-rich receptor-like protein kinase 25 [Morella rubra]